MAKKRLSFEMNEERKTEQSSGDFEFDSKPMKECSFSSGGLRTLPEHSYFYITLNLLMDKDAEVRHAANVVLQRLVISPIVAEGLVRVGAIPILLERVSKESDHILELLLQTLHACCLVDPGIALDNKCLETLLPMLKESSVRVKARIAALMEDMVEEAKGRNRCLDWKSVLLYLDMCNYEEEGLLAKAMTALLMTAPGKVMAIAENAIETILPLIKRKNPEVRLNAIKLLTSMSEVPLGRTKLIEKIPQLLHLLNDKVPNVRRAAKTLNAIITFTF